MGQNVYLENSRSSAKDNNKLPIIGLCISYNYSDTLNFMLRANSKHFNKLYIVTQKDDTATVELCKKYKNVEILFFNFSTNGKKFDKYGGMKHAQRIIYEKYPIGYWYVNIDSDIILPNNIIDILKKHKLDKKNIYGITRKEVLKSSQLKNKNKLNDIDLQYKNILGYFQLYNRKVLQNSNFKNAADGDFNFCYNFKKKIRLHNLKCLHLGPAYKNWNGKVEGFKFDKKKIYPKDLHYNIRENNFKKTAPRKSILAKKKVSKKTAPKKRH